jgi:hypothetical protein
VIPTGHKKKSADEEGDNIFHFSKFLNKENENIFMPGEARLKYRRF